MLDVAMLVKEKDLPREVRIGPIDFEVRVVRGLTNADGNRKLDGHIDFSKCLISVEDDLDRQIQWQGLWHEIIHAIFLQAKIEPEDEEKIVDILAYGVMQVIRDNPVFGGG